MKNPVFFLAALLLFGFTFTACQKDQNTLEDQVAGHWQSIRVEANHKDLSSTYTYDLLLQQSKTFTLTLDFKTSLSGQSVTQVSNGSWTTDDSAKTLLMTNNETNAEAVYTVSEISPLSMTLETTVNGSTTKIQLEKK